MKLLIANYFKLGFVIILLLNSFMILSQNIQATYKINIRPVSELNDTSILSFKYYSNIEAQYLISGINDSVLIFNVKSMVNELGVNILDIVLLDENNVNIPKEFFSYTFINNELQVLLKKSFTKLVLKCDYKYLGTTPFFIQESNKRDIIILGGAENFEIMDDMFFNYKEVKISNQRVELLIPNSLFAASSLCFEKKILLEDSSFLYTYKFSKSDTSLSNIIFVLLNNEIYKKIDIGGISFYYRKSNNDSAITVLNNVSSKLSSSLFSIDTSLVNRKINIIEFDWSKNGYASGRGFNDLVLVDRSYMTKFQESLIHETLHPLLEIDFKNSEKGFYFINESIIEYLALYINFHNDPENFKKEIEAKRNSNLFVDSDTIIKVSLYDINENVKETQCQIYYKGPVLLYDFATKIGEEKFYSTIIKFFIDNKNKSNVTYNDFLIYLLKSGIDHNLVVEFDNRIRHISLDNE